MTDRGSRGILAAVVVTALVVGAGVVPMFAAAIPANQIPVEHLPEEGDSLAQPSGSAWQEADTVTVPLSSAPSSVPNAADTEISKVKVTAARTDSRLYVRLRWNDQTPNRTAEDPRDFVDGAAVQLPANTSAHPAIAMGSERNMVNVWYWTGTGETDELLSGGAGTVTEYPEPAVETTATHADGNWTVVYARDLAPEGANRTQIQMQRDVDVAFAVWDGANMERSGQKAVSEWYHFPLGPEPQGPPFETLLWVVAGLAIVAVVVVTAQAVRRRGGA